MPTKETTKATTKAPAAAAGALTAEELALLEELRARAAAHGGPDTVSRELTTRERVLAGTLRERDHLDGCPAIDDVALSGARIEAYGETRPADPARGLGPRPVTIVRCVECGGARIFDDYARPDDLIVAELERRARDDDSPDTALDSTL